MSNGLHHRVEQPKIPEGYNFWNLIDTYAFFRKILIEKTPFLNFQSHFSPIKVFSTPNFKGLHLSPFSLALADFFLENVVYHPLQYLTLHFVRLCVPLLRSPHIYQKKKYSRYIFFAKSKAEHSSVKWDKKKITIHFLLSIPLKPLGGRSDPLPNNIMHVMVSKPIPFYLISFQSDHSYNRKTTSFSRLHFVSNSWMWPEGVLISAKTAICSQSSEILPNFPTNFQRYWHTRGSVRIASEVSQ